MDFINELRWRGMLHDMTPGLEEALTKGNVTGYVGFDPTADSLHIGNLVPVMLLVHWQRAGNNPIALVGGATGMVGDPSGKSAERQLLDMEAIQHNLDCQKTQLESFLDFEGAHAARVVNNADWFKNFSFLDFIRGVGKHITVNYMTSKDSVKKRLESGMSFTEFSYQLVQGYDFYHLWKNEDCTVQLGGSDQWGNITTGTELIRRMGGGHAFALTAPLITKADGSKFGKSEGGNVWIDKNKTSAYKFYQYWINAGDEEVSKYIRIFTLKSKDEIEALEAQHAQDPGQRILQKELAADITRRVHSQADLETAIAASSLLFGKSSKEAIEALPEAEFLSVFEGVPSAEVSKSDLVDGVSIIDLLSDATAFLNSKGEARRALKENSISVNKAKVAEDCTVTEADLISGKHILLQRGKKNYFLVRCT
ncbi:tyrosine--tRNA ligase [Flavobacteriales bacterium]|jgi:tyrosyl-tRNA synthetase|nr:tyrosine--tRNA ligase [Flavobacteriales bacterium]MDA8771818.1 tyrosine--tRNA ligase [Flavobacteriales bacterium]